MSAIPEVTPAKAVIPAKAGIQVSNLLLKKGRDLGPGVLRGDDHDLA